MAKLKYDEDTFPLLAEGYARNGLSDVQIAANLRISKFTFYEYVKRFPNFSNALKRGKSPVDNEVENALLKRAKGFEYEEKHTEVEIGADGVPRPAKIKTVKRYVAPDTGAIAFWLKNRRPEDWRERQEITAKIVSEFESKTDAELEQLANGE